MHLVYVVQEYICLNNLFSFCLDFDFSVLPTDEREKYYIMEDVIQEEQRNNSFRPRQLSLLSMIHHVLATGYDRIDDILTNVSLIVFSCSCSGNNVMLLTRFSALMMSCTHKTTFSFLKVLIKRVPYVPMKELCIFLFPQLITTLKYNFIPVLMLKEK